MTKSAETTTGAGPVTEKPKANKQLGYLGGSIFTLTERESKDEDLAETATMISRSLGGTHSEGERMSIMHFAQEHTRRTRKLTRINGLPVF